MLDDVFVKTIRLKLLFSLENRELLGRRELKEKPLHLAVRAVALYNRLREIELNLVADIPAVAGAFVFFHRPTIPLSLTRVCAL